MEILHYKHLKNFNLNVSTDYKNTVNSNDIISYHKIFTLKGIGSSKIYNKKVNGNYDLMTHNQFNEDYIADKQITTGNLNIDYIQTPSIVCNSIVKTGSILEEYYSNNVNIFIGKKQTGDLDKLVVGTKQSLFNSTFDDKYNNNLDTISQTSSLLYNINYDMNCLDSNQVLGDLNINYNNNLNETIKNRTFSLRAIGGGTRTPLSVTIEITELNGLILSGSTHKKPEEYVPNDTISGVTLKRNDLILFNYTPGQQFFDLEISGNTVSGLDYSCLNGIYKIDFS